MNQHVARALLVVALLAPLAKSVLAAQDVRWSDLTVPILPTDDPAYGLSFELRKSFEIVLFAAEKEGSGKSLSAGENADLARAKERLDKSGQSAAKLVEKESRFRAKLVLQRTSVREEWENKDIRIPGYVLPLEFEGDRVTEFVLVPYAGACVHVPPPPANQMIIVRSKDGYLLEGLFDPVWVTGRLRIARSSQPVALSDGTAEFEVGYAMEASSVLRYRQ